MKSKHKGEILKLSEKEMKGFQKIKFDVLGATPPKNLDLIKDDPALD